MYIRAKKLAEFLGLTVKTVYTLEQAGQLPRSVKIGKSRLWDEEEIKSYLDGLKANNNMEP